MRWTWRQWAVIATVPLWVPAYVAYGAVMGGYAVAAQVPTTIRAVLAR